MTAGFATAASRRSARHAWRDVAVDADPEYTRNVSKMHSAQKEHTHVAGRLGLQYLHDLAHTSGWEPLAHVTVAHPAN